MKYRYPVYLDENPRNHPPDVPLAASHRPLGQARSISSSPAAFILLTLIRANALSRFIVDQTLLFERRVNFRSQNRSSPGLLLSIDPAKAKCSFDDLGV